MKLYKLDHARMDQMHCVTPGLFRSLKKGERKTSKLDITYTFSKDKTIEIKAPEPLGADDLRVLQGLVAMAGPEGIILKTQPKTQEGIELRDKLQMQFDAVKQDSLVIKSSYRELAKEIGYSSKSENTKPIQDSIERLWRVSIIVQNGTVRQGFNLLSFYKSDLKEGKLFVALNPIIASTIMGVGHHIRINMNEVRALKSDAARLIHQRLCGWINEGKDGNITLASICSYIWHDDDENIKSELKRKRKERARNALNELDSLGWKIDEYVHEKYKISRPK